MPVLDIERRCEEFLKSCQPQADRLDQPGDQARDERHRCCGGNQPANPAQIEPAEREATLYGELHDAAGDQIAGDDEEDIDSDEAAGDLIGPEVKYHHAEDGDRAEGLDMPQPADRP